VDLVTDQLEAHHLAVPSDHGIDICYRYCNVIDDPAVGRLEDLCKHLLLVTGLEGGVRELTACAIVLGIQRSTVDTMRLLIW